MPGLLSPQPLLPAFEIVDHRPARRFLKSPPIYLESLCPSASCLPAAQSLPRFKSPPPPLSDPYAALPSSPSPRRRPKPCPPSHRRRRHASRVDYRSELLQLHPFDKLPWIASLDATDDASPADLADLSQLPDPTPLQIRPSGPGPIRRRKLSLRSSPLLPHSSAHTPAHTDNHDDNDHLFHQCTSNLFARDTPSRPSTPTPRIDFDPTRVTFRHLMPVPDSSSDDDDV